MNFDSKKNIANQFEIEGEIIDIIDGYGNGHINDTYRIETEKRLYLLQKINKNVFQNPENLMENIVNVTAFIREQIEKEGGDVYRETLNIIKTKDKKNFYMDDEGEYWRMYIYIADTYSFDLVEHRDDFYQSGLAFGKFQKQLEDYPANHLHYTIKDFHHTPKRFKTFLEVLEKAPEDRMMHCEKEVQFILERQQFMSTLWDLHEAGKLQLKVSHNDTKLNNVLIDKKTRKALCVIDLDTVMPGFVLDDFGDAIRFGASTGEEDEKDLSKVNFDLDLYAAFTDGFLEGASDSITEVEINHFPEGAKMMTLECGMRFLTDYLDGDQYFKTDYDDHNLVRTKTQLKLVSDMEKQWDQMKSIALSSYAKYVK